MRPQLWLSTAEPWLGSRRTSGARGAEVCFTISRFLHRRPFAEKESRNHRFCLIDCPGCYLGRIVMIQ